MATKKNHTKLFLFITDELRYFTIELPFKNLTHLQKHVEPRALEMAKKVDPTSELCKGWTRPMIIRLMALKAQEAIEQKKVQA